MDSQRRLLWFRRLALLGAALAATVVVLGAWVRLTDAGLGCPDWPGCYGHFYPNAGHAAQSGFQFGKALHEMIHRYFALTLGIIIASLLVWALLFRKDRDQPLGAVALLFVIVCLQGALGAFTVTMLLKPLIVTAHLFGGLTTLALLWWLSLTPETRQLSEREMALRKYAWVGLAALIVQIFLGGWTSSNYAAVACPDFPTCQQSWWPRGPELGVCAVPAACWCSRCCCKFRSGWRPCIGACLCRSLRCTTPAPPFWSSAWCGCCGRCGRRPRSAWYP